MQVGCLCISANGSVNRMFMVIIRVEIVIMIKAMIKFRVVIMVWMVPVLFVMVVWNMRDNRPFVLLCSSLKVTVAVLRCISIYSLENCMFMVIVWVNVMRMIEVMV